MKKSLLYTLLLILPGISLSAQTQKRYWVLFKDKNNSPFSVSNPQAFLSQKSIDRRNRQSITIKTNDLPVNPFYVDSIKHIGGLVLCKSKWMNAVAVEADSVQLQKIQSLPFVLNSKRVKRMGKGSQPQDKFTNEAMRPLAESHARYSNLAGYDYGSAYNQIHLSHGESLHQKGFRGENMTIAVIDAGFYKVDVLPAFDSLRANNQILGTWDFVAREASVYEDHDHGMSVLSTIGGNIPGQLVGTAPKAKFWLLRSEDAATEYEIEECYWAAAAEFADSVGADMITTSLGYTQFDSLDGKWNPSNHKYSDLNGNTAIGTRAADFAASKGILVLASAGNEGGTPWHHIGVPADADSIITVGAVRSNGNFAGFSSWGPSADGRVKPNVVAQGYNAYVQGSAGDVGPASGTSFSCPIMAGMVACLWQAHPQLNNMKIIDAVQKSANHYTTPTDSLGYGIPDFDKADLLLNNIVVPSISADRISVFPNPSGSPSFNVNLSSDTVQGITMELFDLIGKKVFQASYRIVSGVNVISVEDAKLLKGMYSLRITSDNKETWVTKIVRY